MQKQNKINENIKKKKRKKDINVVLLLLPNTDLLLQVKD